jgi:hypothetical protein
MDFAEFWVLDTAVESCISLRTISGGDRYLRFQWNKPPHGLVHERLVQLMVRLADTGYVEFYLDCDPVTATAAEISSALAATGNKPCDSGELGYCLTEKGASAWEAIAKPDWARYFDARWEDGVINITAATSQVLDDVIKQGPFCWEITIVGGADERFVLKPWEATYWKTLPEAHKVTLSYTTEFPPEIDNLRKELSPIEFEVRRQKLVGELRRWYQNPFY